MTGAGVAAGPTELGDLSVEIRSINGRGLTIKPRLDPGCFGFESDLERRVREHVQRGTVTVILEVTQPRQGAGGFIDGAAARAAFAELVELSKELGLVAPIGWEQLLRIPGVLGAAQTARTRISRDCPPQAAALVDQALARMVEDRRREGEATRLLLESLVDELLTRRASALARAPQLVVEYRARLVQRVNEFLDGRGRALADQDVVREVAVFADRADVTEELERLGVHCGHIRALLAADGPVGRKMEFLLQEVLREVNTLGSKSPDVDIAESVVAMKSSIDKMKEQAANLE